MSTELKSESKPKTRRVLIRRLRECAASPHRSGSPSSRSVTVARRIEFGQTLIGLDGDKSKQITLPKPTQHSPKIVAIPEAVWTNEYSATHRWKEDSEKLGSKVVNHESIDEEAFKVESELKRQLHIYESRMQRVCAARERDLKEEHEAMQTLLKGDQIRASKEERILQNWVLHQTEWALQAQRAATAHQGNSACAVINDGDDWRERVEEWDLIQEARPLHKKYGNNYWKMMLRGEGVSHIMIGNLFSGLYCEVKERTGRIDECIRRPKPLSLTNQPNPSKKVNRAHNNVDQRTRRKMEKLKPFIVKDAFGLIVEGTDLFALTPTQPLYSVYFKNSKNASVMRLDDNSNTFNDNTKLESDQQICQPVDSNIASSSLKVDKSIVVLETTSGKSASSFISIHNNSRTTTYYRWAPQPLPLKQQQPFKISNLFSYSQSTQSIVPGQEKKCYFSFNGSNDSGVFMMRLNLQCDPPLEFGSSLSIILKAVCKPIDTESIHRNDVQRNLEKNTIRQIVKETLSKIISNVHPHPIPLAIRPKLFYVKNLGKSLWYYEDVLRNIEQIVETVRNSFKQSMRKDVIWDYSIDTLFESIAYLETRGYNEEMSNCRKHLNELLLIAKQRPNPSPDDYEVLSNAIKNITLSMGRISFDAYEHARIDVEKERELQSKQAEDAIDSTNTKKKTANTLSKKKGLDTDDSHEDEANRVVIEARIDQLKKVNFYEIVRNQLINAISLLSMHRFDTTIRHQIVEKVNRKLDLYKNSFRPLICGIRSNAFDNVRGVYENDRVIAACSSENHSIIMLHNKTFILCTNVKVNEEDEDVEIPSFDAVVLHGISDWIIRSISIGVDSHIHPILYIVDECGDAFAYDCCTNSLKLEIIGKEVVQYMVTKNGRKLALTASGRLMENGFDMKGELSGQCITKIAIGDNHVTVLTSKHRIYGWGSNNYGQIGIGSDDAHIDQPVEIIIERSDVAIIDIACARDHCLALTDKDTIYSWGCTLYGGLGQPKRLCAAEKRPKLIASLINKQITGIYAGTHINFARCKNAMVYGWGKEYGSNTDLFVDQNDLSSSDHENEEDDEGESAKTIASGATSSIEVDEHLITWTPKRVNLPIGLEPIHVVAGGAHSFILTN